MHSDKPLVSVIMPAYNAEKYIVEAIESILNQTYEHLELLICDDCSSDHTVDILKKFEKDSRVRIFSNDMNKGAAATRNLLIREAKGAYIALQDADDISHHSRLEEQVNLIKDDEKKFCGCDLEYVKTDGKQLGIYIKKDAAVKNTSFPRVGDSTLLLHKRQIDKIGLLYRSFFKDNEDYDLGLRLLDHFLYANLDKPYYYYRNVPNSLSKNFSDPSKMINGDLVRHFAKQRKEKGGDDLELENFAAINIKRKELIKFYEGDTTALERRAISFLISLKMYRPAFLHSFKAIKKDYKNQLTYRSLGYVCRSYLTNLLRIN